MILKVPIHKNHSSYTTLLKAQGSRIVNRYLNRQKGGGGVEEGLKQGCGSGFNRVSRSGSGIRIRIRIQEGKNDPQKYKKFVKVHVLKCWMASFES
jgi:hypothetical protein